MGVIKKLDKNELIIHEQSKSITKLLELLNKAHIMLYMIKDDGSKEYQEIWFTALAIKKEINKKKYKKVGYNANNR